ncbi:NADH-ubiquinone oxidoreductase subunit iron-sulfur protein [Gracilaria domingensis]|nr:NADH-ubiquinone oxidoreductase subunit iron-sulfur protein [Gracilaria domingensis]
MMGERSWCESDAWIEADLVKACFWKSRQFPSADASWGHAALWLRRGSLSRGAAIYSTLGDVQSRNGSQMCASDSGSALLDEVDAAVKRVERPDIQKPEAYSRKRRLTTNLAHILESAVLAHLRAGIFIGDVQLDILDRMAESTAAAVADGDIAVNFDDARALNLLHGVGAPFRSDALQVGIVGNRAERKMHARAKRRRGQRAGGEPLQRDDGAKEHCGAERWG